jgi:hypothetical protein
MEKAKMAIRTATSTRKASSSTTRKSATATKAASKSTASTEPKVTRTRGNYDVKAEKKVSKSIGFPTGRTRTSTNASPYTPLIAQLANGTKEFIVFEPVKDEKEFVSFQNTLRNIAGKNHGQKCQVVWVKEDSPQFPSGIYVRLNGKLTPRKAESTAKK